MNTANKITLSRILLIPVAIFFYLATFVPYGKLVAAVIFVFACITDFLDGYVARKKNQVTDLGKFFDTIADKVLIMAGLILIITAPVKGVYPIVYPSYLGIICVIIILARELIISALRQITAAKGIIMAADMNGKIKATAQYVAVSLYIFYAFFITDIYPLLSLDIANYVSGVISFMLMIFLVGATILTVYSGISYIVKNRKVFKVDKYNNFVDDPNVHQMSIDEIEKMQQDLDEFDV